LAISNRYSAYLFDATIKPVRKLNLFERKTNVPRFSVKKAKQLPIPAALSVAQWSDDWQELPILSTDLDDPLVPIGPLSDYPHLQTNSVYAGEYTDSPYAGGLNGSLLSIFLRRSVAERLQKAQSLLPKNFSLIVFDGYRTLALQQKLFDQYYEALQRLCPDFSPEELLEKTHDFVSAASNNPLRPSPHATGGSVDVAIISSADGEPHMLNFGTPFDYGGKEAYLRYFEELQEQRPLTNAERQASDNRRILFQLMSTVGMQGLPTEWWHFSAPESQMGAYVAKTDHAVFAAATFGPEQQEFERRRRTLAGQLNKPTELPKAAIIRPGLG
jgi:D-alanyl-D-alanine dipeptidase